jgi:hypothetical protein
MPLGLAELSMRQEWLMSPKRPKRNSPAEILFSIVWRAKARTPALFAPGGSSLPARRSPHPRDPQARPSPRRFGAFVSAPGSVFDAEVLAHMFGDAGEYEPNEPASIVQGRIVDRFIQ